MVVLMLLPAVTGATLPGRDRAQKALTPSRAAASKSTPPGLEARSMTRQPGFRSASSASRRTRTGTVLTTRSILDHIPALTLPFDYTVFLTVLVLVWYILTELGSIVENAGRLGAPLPAWLSKAIAALESGVDSTGDKLTQGEKKE